MEPIFTNSNKVFYHNFSVLNKILVKPVIIITKTFVFSSRAGYKLFIIKKQLIECINLTITIFTYITLKTEYHTSLIF